MINLMNAILYIM